MAKTWLANKVDIYFEDIEQEKTIRKGFSNVIENPSDEQVRAFADAIDSLYDLDKAYTVLTETHKVD